MRIPLDAIIAGAFAYAVAPRPTIRMTFGASLKGFSVLSRVSHLLHKYTHFAFSSMRRPKACVMRRKESSENLIKKISFHEHFLVARVYVKACSGRFAICKKNAPSDTPLIWQIALHIC